MAKRPRIPEQIVREFRQPDELTADGKTADQIATVFEVSTPTDHI